MNAAEAVKVATDAGMTFAIEGSRLRVRGGTPEARATLAPLLAPLAKDIAGLLRSRGGCSLGQGDPARCPACCYIHGSLAERDPCSRCGSEAWTVSLVDAEGCGRTCSSCLRSAAPARSVRR